MPNYRIPDGSGGWLLDVPGNTPFTLTRTINGVPDEVKYPRNFLANATPAELASLGIEVYTPTPPAPSPARVPDSLPKISLVRALRASDRWPAAKTAIAAGPEEAREDWEMSFMVGRNDQATGLLKLAPCSMTDAAIDALFIEADAL